MNILFLHHLIFIVYKAKKYIECVEACTQMSMWHAIEDVKAQPDYAQRGEVRSAHSLPV